MSLHMPPFNLVEVAVVALVGKNVDVYDHD